MKLDDVRKLTSLASAYTEKDQSLLHAQLRAMGMEPGNIYQELEMSQPFVNTHRDTSFASSTVSLHSHKYCEVLYCRTDCGVEYLVGPNRYRLRRGDVIFILPGISHRPIFPETMAEPYVRDVIWIDADFLERLIDTFPESTPSIHEWCVPLRTAGTRWETMGELFRAGVEEEQHKRPGWEVAVLGNTLTILANLARAMLERSAGTMRAEKPELLDRITAYIEENYATHITIGDLARQFYVSESTVSHLFCQRMGVSVYRYITQRRLIEAKNRIQQGMQLENVSRAVGFTDYSAFYRAFKQEFGISPRQFAQM